MRKKLISFRFVVLLLMALTVLFIVPVFANPADLHTHDDTSHRLGCPAGAASGPGQGAVPPRGIHDDGGHGPFDDNSAHGSGTGQKNEIRCEPAE